MFTSTNNYLFDLKVREYIQFNVPHKLFDNMLFNCEKEITLIGCDKCYGKTPYSTTNGYAIDTGDLVTYYEKYTKYLTVHEDIAKNCWLCSKCSRLFFELLPNYEFLEVKNVSI